MDTPTPPHGDKPTPQTHTAYDYHACRNYLQAQGGYDERDYAGKWLAPDPAQVPYQDFWHFVCDKGDVRNDSFFTMSSAWAEGAEPWQQEILHKYLDAFGTTDPHTGEQTIDFFVSW